jgi:hypothetical protein
MPTIRTAGTSAIRTQGVRRTEEVSPTTPSPITLKTTTQAAEKTVSRLGSDLKKLEVGATQVVKATHEASVYADEVRSNDAYTNFIAGMQQIDKHYSDKMAKGARLTSKDIKDKKDWQSKFHQDMINKSISEGDETNLTYKTKFIDPSTEMLMKTNAADTQNQFAAIKFEITEKNDNEITTLGAFIKGDNFQKYLKDGTNLGIPNYNEKVSTDVANAHNAGLAAGELNATQPQTTMKGLVDKYYPNVLNYDEKTGAFTRGKGFDDISDEGYKSMLQALNIRLKGNTSGKGVYNDKPYTDAKDRVKAAIAKNVPVSEEDIITMERESEKLDKNPIYVSGDQTGMNRRLALQQDADDVKIYNSKRDVAGSYFAPDGSILDSTDYNAAAHSGLTEGLFGHEIDGTFLKNFAKGKSTEVEQRVTGLNFNTKDVGEYKAAVAAADKDLDILHKNQAVTGETPPLFKQFEDVATNVAGNKSLNINQGMLYARYVKMNAKYAGKVENVSKRIEDIVNNPEIALPKKLVAINNAVMQDTVTNSAKVNQPERVKAVGVAVEEKLSGAFTWDSKAPAGTGRVFSAIYSDTAPIAVGAEIDSRDSYLLGEIGVTTARGDYLGLVLPKGVTEGQTKKYMKSVVSAFNKGKVDKIDEDDITATPTIYKGDIQYTLTVKQGGKNHTVILNSDTVKYNYAIDKE